ncbi:MAG: hypothetical protein K0S11_1439 [Gammaproteobacteria bacterium]|jgi:hypothetical protein|nr:hypothetical protein [Gammaproteobacteria bacterium]
MHNKITHKDQFHELRQQIQFIYEDLDNIRALFPSEEKITDQVLNTNLKVIKALSFQFEVIYKQLRSLPIQVNQDTGDILDDTDELQNDEIDITDVSTGSAFSHLNKMYEELTILLARALYILIKVRKSLQSAQIKSIEDIQTKINTISNIGLLNQQVTAEINKLWLEDFRTSLKNQAELLKEQENNSLIEGYRVALYLNLHLGRLGESADEYHDLTRNLTLVTIFNILHGEAYELDQKATFAQKYFGNKKVVKSFINAKLNEINDHLALTGQTLQTELTNKIAFETLSKRLKQQLQPRWFERKAIRLSKETLRSELKGLESTENTTYTAKLNSLQAKLSRMELCLTALDKDRRPFLPYTHTDFYKKTITGNLMALQNYLSEHAKSVKKTIEDKGTLANGIRMENLYKKGLLGNYCFKTEKHELPYANNPNYKITPSIIESRPLTLDVLLSCIQEFQVQTLETKSFMKTVATADLRRAQIFADLLKQAPDELSCSIILLGLLRSSQGNRFKVHVAKHIAECLQYKSKSVDYVAKVLIQFIVDRLTQHNNTQLRASELPKDSSSTFYSFEKAVKPILEKMLAKVNKQVIVENDNYADILTELKNISADLNESKLIQPKTIDRIQSIVDRRRSLSNSSQTVEINSNDSAGITNVDTDDTSTDSDDLVTMHSTDDNIRLSTDISNGDVSSPRRPPTLYTTASSSLNNSSSLVIKKEKFDKTPYTNAVRKFQKDLCNKGSFLGRMSNKGYLRAQIYLDMLNNNKVNSKFSTMIVFYAALTGTQDAVFNQVLCEAAVNLLNSTQVDATTSQDKNSIIKKLELAITYELNHVKNIKDIGGIQLVKEVYKMTDIMEKVIKPITGYVNKLSSYNTGDYNIPMNFLNQIAKDIETGKIAQDRKAQQTPVSDSQPTIKLSRKLEDWLTVGKVGLQKQADESIKPVETLCPS